jgi:hypothetical protein
MQRGREIKCPFRSGRVLSPYMSRCNNCRASNSRTEHLSPARSNYLTYITNAVVSTK